MLYTILVTVSLFAGGGTFCPRLRGRDAESDDKSRRTPKNLKTVNLCEKGRMQSPIDLPIQLDDLLRQKETNLINFTVPLTNATLLNNGYTVELEGRTEGSSPLPMMTVGSLKKQRFQFRQLHFHWGQGLQNGTEHHIGGKEYSIELHIVMSNISPGARKKDLTAVLAVLFKVSNVSQTYFSPFVEAMKKLGGPNTTMDFPGSVNVSCFLPKLDFAIYSYRGSLTTPPCTEGVYWIVFQQPQPISLAEFESFWEVSRRPGNEAMLNNVRPIQKLNGRAVFRSKVFLS